MLKLANKLDIHMNTKQLKRAFKEMDANGNQEVSYAEFSSWWNMKQEVERRWIRRTIRELWDNADDDKDGSLSRDEVIRLLNRSRKLMKSWDPPFDLDRDWAMMCGGIGGVDPNAVEGVTYAEFEDWWKRRNGIEDVDIPVFPEYMVRKISEVGASASADTQKKHSRTGRELWAFLRPRLRLIVRMQTQWGDMHKLYKSYPVSMFTELPLQSCIRDPESTFSMAWDLLQVVFLLYVAITVPFYAGFDINFSHCEPMWYLEVIVDMYFIVDLVLNFRTAYYDENGIREDRPERIAKNYVKTWFIIDFPSCLPIQYFVHDYTTCNSAGDASVPDNQALKVFRLLKLSKMLRLARLKKLMLKYEQSFTFNQYLGLMVISFSILFLSHLLSCFWHMVGMTQESHCSEGAADYTNFPEGCCDPRHPRYNVDGACLRGWVHKQFLSQGTWCEKDTHYTCNLNLSESDGSESDGTESDPFETPIATRFFTSLYFVFNSLEPNYDTDAEKIVAWFAEIVIAFIYGALAGLMGSVIISMQGGEKDHQMKIRAVREWMIDKKVPKEQSEQLLKFLNIRHQQQASVDEAALMEELPPLFAGELARHLYYKFLSTVPLFRNLAPEIIDKLCHEVTPMLAMRQQVIIQEGTPGVEMYFVMKGEVEVTKNGDRLGFLSEGSFFGEIPLIALSYPEVHQQCFDPICVDYRAEHPDAEEVPLHIRETHDCPDHPDHADHIDPQSGHEIPGSEIRTRTVRAVTDCELCYLKRDRMRELQRNNAELEKRIRRFARAGGRKNIMERLKILRLRKEAQDLQRAKSKEQSQTNGLSNMGSANTSLEKLSEDVAVQRAGMFTIRDDVVDMKKQLDAIRAAIETLAATADSKTQALSI
eukprot:SAG31_NODE_61_length_29286_cov_444.645973_3_plen_875_part_00